jgi:hypothetical protein
MIRIRPEKKIVVVLVLNSLSRRVGRQAFFL